MCKKILRLEHCRMSTAFWASLLTEMLVGHLLAPLLTDRSTHRAAGEAAPTPHSASVIKSALSYGCSQLTCRGTAQSVGDGGRPTKDNKAVCFTFPLNTKGTQNRGRQRHGFVFQVLMSVLKCL